MNLLSFIIFLQFIFHAQSHTITAYITKFDCVNLSPHYVRSYKCECNNSKNMATKLTVNFMLTQDVYNVTTDMTMTVKRNGKMVKMYTFRVNYCQAMTMAHDNFMLQIAFKELRRVSNLPLKCPLRENTLYYIKNFTIDASKIPRYLPTMDFTVAINYFYYGQKSFIMKAEGKFERVNQKG